MKMKTALTALMLLSGFARPASATTELEHKYIELFVKAAGEHTRAGRKGPLSTRYCDLEGCLDTVKTVDDQTTIYLHYYVPHDTPNIAYSIMCRYVPAGLFCVDVRTGLNAVTPIAR